MGSEGSGLLELGSELVWFASNQSFLSWHGFLDIRNECLGFLTPEKLVLELLSVKAWLCQAVLAFLKDIFYVLFFFF